MNNKILSIKNASAIFLATVLVLGTITLLSTPSFMKDVQAQQDHRTNSYDSEYGMDNDYKDRYGKDIYESQYSSYGKDNYKSKDNVIVKKINCNNVNVNVNGLELNGLPPFLVNLLASDGQDGYGDASSYGSSSYGYGGQSSYDNKNSFKFVCINNNNNTVIEEEETPVTPVEECAETDEIEACFANAEFMFGGVEFPEFVEALEAGITVEINGQDITLRSFNDICLAFEGLTTYEQLTDAVGEIEDATGANFGEGFFAVVNCLAEAIGIPIPSG